MNRQIEIPKLEERFSIKELGRFLRDAKRRIYASQDEVVAVLPSSRQYEYSRDSLHYRDIYFGESRFAGVETVASENQVRWSMGYSGGVLAEITDGLMIREIFIFLGQSLRLVEEVNPFRGPPKHSAGDFSYFIEIEGDISRFHGVEVIEREGKVVYTYRCSGGMLAQ
jgi:hypothetical protein